MGVKIYANEFIAIFTNVSACIGAVPHLNEGDGCMVPAPMIGIGFAIVYGVAGLIVSALLACWFIRPE